MANNYGLNENIELERRNHTAHAKQIEPLISVYQDGEASKSERQIVEQYLADCSYCRAIFDSYQRLEARLQSFYSDMPVPVFAPLDLNAEPKFASATSAERQNQAPLTFTGDATLNDSDENAPANRPRRLPVRRTGFQNFITAGMAIAAAFLIFVIGYVVINLNQRPTDPTGVAGGQTAGVVSPVATTAPTTTARPTTTPTPRASLTPDVTPAATTAEAGTTEQVTILPNPVETPGTGSLQAPPATNTTPPVSPAYVPPTQATTQPARPSTITPSVPRTTVAVVAPPTATPAPVVPTATPQLTFTPNADIARVLVTPTATVAPTSTPVPPTATIAPTVTPVPPTVAPTATPVPPTATAVPTQAANVLPGLIAYVDKTDGQIHLVDNAGGNNQVVSNQETFRFVTWQELVWSEDGSRMVAVGFNNTSRTPSLYLLNPATRQLDYLVDGFAPAWSPDGRRLAYLGGQITVNGNVRAGQVSIIDVTTRQARNLAPNALERLTPQWFDDGNRLLVGQDRVLNVSDGKLLTFTLPYTHNCVAISLSPQGNRLATLEQTNGRLELAIYDFSNPSTQIEAGSAIARIANPATGGVGEICGTQRLNWTNNSRYVYHYAGNASNFATCVLPAAGGAGRCLTNVYRPSFNGTATHLVDYSPASGLVYVIPISANARPANLNSITETRSGPSWQPR
jgi:anti-sigma factor RsiW